MQNTLLDILIIGLLVVLFASIYRRHATVRVRFWLLGWFFILVHLVSAAEPGGCVGQKLVAAVSESVCCCAERPLRCRRGWFGKRGGAMRAGAAAECSAGCLRLGSDRFGTRPWHAIGSGRRGAGCLGAVAVRWGGGGRAPQTTAPKRHSAGGGDSGRRHGVAGRAVAAGHADSASIHCCRRFFF